MYAGPTVVELFAQLGISHLIWIPDSALGTWESALAHAPTPHLIRTAREGEALAVAAGLHLGGARPIVAMQCTGLFEAGDALRNFVHDLGLPLRLIIGVRSWQAVKAGRSQDNCPLFTEPILTAWQIPYTLINPVEQPFTDFADALRCLMASGRAGALLLAE